MRPTCERRGRVSPLQRRQGSSGGLGPVRESLGVRVRALYFKLFQDFKQGAHGLLSRWPLQVPC